MTGGQKGRRKSQWEHVWAISRCNLLLNLQNHIAKKSIDCVLGMSFRGEQGELLSSGSYRPVLKGSPVDCMCVDLGPGSTTRAAPEQEARDVSCRQEPGAVRLHLYEAFSTMQSWSKSQMKLRRYEVEPKKWDMFSDLPQPQPGHPVYSLTGQIIFKHLLRARSKLVQWQRWINRNNRCLCRVHILKRVIIGKQVYYKKIKRKFL